MISPNISIIVPTYNVSQYIKKCLESVSNQTYKGKIECLIIDDCGTDESMAIAQKFIDDYNGRVKFRIIRHSHNRGLSAARNTGISESCGEFIFFLDSDDWIIPECIELMVECINKHPESEMVQAGTICTEQVYHDWLGIEHKKLPEYSDDMKWIKSMILKRCVLPVTSWNKLLSRSFITNNNLYFKENLIHEDELWNWYLAKYLSKLSICNHNTYHYVIRNDSIIRNESEMHEFAFITILCDAMDTIDSFCKKEQLVFIFDLFFSKYIYLNEYRIEYRNLLCNFIKNTTGKYRFILILIYLTPYFMLRILRIQRLYNRLFKK